MPDLNFSDYPERRGQVSVNERPSSYSLFEINSSVASTSGAGLVKSDGSSLSAATSGTDYVGPGLITTSGLTMATARLLGRTTASTGAAEEISVGSGLLLSGGILSATGSGGGLTLDEVEVNLGSAKHGGKFTISGSGMTAGKPVLISQASGPYTGKGTRADEAEMDQVSVTAKVTDATTITAYWTSARRVRGNFKFNYQVSA